jgi:hypothetical protein
VTVLLVVHAAATLAMAGLVWFVQVVHYPLFSAVGVAGFPAYAAGHMRRTGRVVGPLMIAEAATALLLVVLAPGPLTVAGAALVGALWASTWLVQAPRHRRLAEGWDPAVHRRLVVHNWARTAMWTARGAIALALLASA